MPSESSSEEEQLAAWQGGAKAERPPRRLAVTATALAGAGLLALLGCAALAALRPAGGAVAQPPLTVRALLESRELSDLAADNLIAMGGDALVNVGREAVRTHASQALLNISAEIREQDPEAHRRLDTLEVSDEHKEAVLRVLRHYGDERMLRLSDDISDAVRQTIEENGDHEHLKRRLLEKLQPKLGELRELSEEMFPGSGPRMMLDVDGLGVVGRFKEWEPATEAVGIPRSSPARRLAGVSADGGVRAQAATFFEALEARLGEDMPRAPARLLQESGSSKTGEKESFMDCIIKAASSANVMKICECISANIKEVIAMMMNFVKGNKR